MKKSSKHQTETYIFTGVVLPERAQLSFNTKLEFSHISTKKTGKAEVSIILNQILVTFEADQKWDIFDLRNVVKTILQNHLALVGYLRGYAYDFEITRVLNPNDEVDYVYGIDIPIIEKRSDLPSLDEKLSDLLKKTSGPHGIYLNRCFNDLVSSMKHADDTGFYCYRAIESLRNHCSSVNDFFRNNDKRQWEKFREIASIKKDDILFVKGFADPTRHGDLMDISSEDRGKIFNVTWDIVDSYLGNID